MVKITQKFIPKSQSKQRPGYFMHPQFITVHNTANSSKGADAEMHSRYLLNGAGGRYASWHFTVDDTEIYQHLPLDEPGWHAGDGSSGSGNRKSIGIEICENADGDFQKAVSNAQWLIRKLMKEQNIDINNVVTHKHWSGKNCPRLLLNTWDSFKDGITDVLQDAPTDSIKPSKSKPNKPKNKANLTIDGYWGRNTTRDLQIALGTVADGEIWGQYHTDTTAQITSGMVYGPPYNGSPVIKKLQHKVGAKKDGLLGTETVWKLQKYLRTPVDGELWKPSAVVKELQRRLNKGTL